MNTPGQTDTTIPGGATGRSLVHLDDLMLPVSLPARARTVIEEQGPASNAARQSDTERGADHGDRVRKPAAASPRSTRSRVASSSRGNPRLTRARLAAVHALVQRIDGRTVPDLLLALANPGWRRLLIDAHFHHGAHQEAWNHTLTIFDAVDGAGHLLLSCLDPCSQNPGVQIGRMRNIG
jgi:hypothetical protein